MTRAAALNSSLQLFYDLFKSRFIWDKVFKSELRKLCGRQPLKNLKGMVCLSRPYPFKIFKGRLPQNLLSPLLNTLFHMKSKFNSVDTGPHCIFYKHHWNAIFLLDWKFIGIKFTLPFWCPEPQFFWYWYSF